MEAHHFGGNAGQRAIAGLDIDLRTALLLFVVEARLEEDVGQERIVDLHEQPGGRDRAILLVQFRRERVEVFFVGLVVLVDADARRGGRRQKYVMVRHSRRLGGGFHIGNVDLNEFLAAILHRPDANDRRDRDQRAAHHRLLEVLGVVFGEGADFLLEQDQLLVGTRLVPLQTLLDVGEEARLGKLAVGHEIDAAIDLLANAVCDCLGQFCLDTLLRRRAGC